MKSTLIAILLCLSLALTACGGDDDDSPDPAKDGSAPAGANAERAGAEEAAATKPKVEVPQGAPPKELVKTDLRQGSGPAAKPGDEVSMHYVLVEYESGKEVEASWDRNEPFSFRLGSGETIPGWEEGVPGMKVGGRRQLIVPPDLAYGEGTLVFVIDLLEVR